jgi:hypothetical protein
VNETRDVLKMMQVWQIIYVKWKVHSIIAHGLVKAGGKYVIY